MLFFIDTGRVVKNTNAITREMESYDMPRMPEEYNITNILTSIQALISESNLSEEQMQKSQGIKFWKPFLKFEKKRIIISTCLRLLADILFILLPFFMRMYENTFHDPEDNSIPPIPFNYETRKVGQQLLWVFIVAGGFFIQYLLRQHAEEQITKAKFRIEQAIKAILFNKLLNAEYISIAKSNPSEMSNILFFGLDSVLSLLLITPALISAPFALILGSILVAIIHSHYFFLIAILFYLLLCFFIIELFNKVSAKHQDEYDKIQSLQSNKIEEFFDNITMIQTNSLGPCLKERFKAIRQAANSTLKYMHMAVGATEVILTQSPFVFTALAMTVYFFLDIGKESDPDSIRLMVCALAPMTIPMKVISESLYKMRLFHQATENIQKFMIGLKMPKELRRSKKVSKKHKQYGETVIKLVHCNFTKDEERKKNIEDVINPSKYEIESKGKDRIILLKDRLNKQTLTLKIEDSDEARKRQHKINRLFSSARTDMDVDYCLRNINFEIKMGEKICIVGDESSGIQDLFLALMNEIKREDGKPSIKGNTVYLDMENPKFIRDTIKENVLLGREFKKELYNRLIELLHIKLTKYPLKDRTVIVEGQKNVAENDISRILMARLLYSEPDIVMMHHFFESIVKERQISTYEELVEGYLANNTVIYSTTNVHLIKKSDRVFVMREGRVIEKSTYSELMEDRKSQLYKYLMTDPAGNTNLFRKVLDQFKISIKRKEEIPTPVSEIANDPKDSPNRKRKEGRLMTRNGISKFDKSVKHSVEAKDSKLPPIISPTKLTAPMPTTKLPVDKAVTPGVPVAAGVPAVEGGSPSNQKPEDTNNDETKKEIDTNAEIQQELENIKMQDLGKLQRNIMNKSSLAMKVVFIGRSSLAFYLMFLSIILTNLTMVISVAITCYWGQDLYGIIDDFTSYMIAYDLIMIFYIAYVVLRDVIFTKLIIANLNRIYSLVTNSLIDSQKEYLLHNPSTRLVYLLTKTVSKIDRELIRSYYMYFDSMIILLVFLGVLNYLMYIFMAIVSIFVMLMLIPIYSSFTRSCVKLSTFTSNHSSELIEVFLTSFNFILPLRNHHIPEYFNKKFAENANMVMRAKIRLENDIHRWFHFRYMIYSTILIFSILILPEIVIRFFTNTFLSELWKLKLVIAILCLMFPVLTNFSKSITDTVVNLICAKSIIKYILELSKNSEDTSIIKNLTAMPKNKSKDVDEEDIQENNLSHFIIGFDPEMRQAIESNNSNKVMPVKGEGQRPANNYLEQPEKRRLRSPNEPTKPLLMLQNVTYKSKIGTALLKGFNFKLYEAERIGIVCEAASGKDYLINLFMTLIQKTDVPEDGPSTYEIIGKTVNLSTSSELRKNMVYLYPKPTLLMGTVMDNIDPFKKHSLDNIIRTLHFLKIIKILQNLTGLTDCEEIGRYLSGTENKIEYYEFFMDELKPKLDPIGFQKQPEKKKKVNRTQKRDKSHVSPGMLMNSGSAHKIGLMSPSLISSSNMKNISPKGNNKTSLTKLNLKEASGTTPQFGPSEGIRKYANNNSEVNEKQIHEKDIQEEDIESGDEEMRELDEIQEEDNHIDMSMKRDLFSLTDKEIEDLKLQSKELLANIKRVAHSKDGDEESEDKQKLMEFFEEQFITEFPVSLPIPERAKRLDEDLDDFDMDYDNHRVQFEDERVLLEQFLNLDVGQNGKNLNEDCKKVIMIAKILLDKPPIVIMDEEAIYLKGISKTFYIRQIFQNLRDTGIVSFIKDLRQLYHYSSVAVLKEGSIQEFGAPFDKIDDKKSMLYSILNRDDIRTLKQLENKLEKNIRKFEQMNKKHQASRSHVTGDNSLMDPNADSSQLFERKKSELGFPSSARIQRTKSPTVTMLGVLGLEEPDQDDEHH